MEEKKPAFRRIKLWIGLPILLLLLFFCSPVESGETKAAILRNIVRQTLCLPMQIQIHHIQDVTVQEGQEVMRCVIFDTDGEEEQRDWRTQKYQIHWYQKQPDGSYALYWGKEGDSGGWMCRGVYHFLGLKMHGYETDYDLQYVVDPSIQTLVISYEYSWLDAEGREQKAKRRGYLSVPKTPMLFCIPEYQELSFAPQEIKDARKSRCSITLSAYDAEGKLLAPPSGDAVLDVRDTAVIPFY